MAYRGVGSTAPAETFSEVALVDPATGRAPSLAVTDPAYDTDGTTILPGGLPGGLKMVSYRTGGNVTSIRATNGTVTVSGDAPSIAGETVAFLQTILRYADGSVLSQGPWIKVV
jgi:hypothetical protein